MTRMLGIGLACLGVASGLACATPHPKGPNAFARRAAFDFDCPAEQLDFVPIKKSEPRTYGVKGCNKRATYSEVCSYNHGCLWVMDGPLQVEVPVPKPAASAAPAPPPASPAASSASPDGSSGAPVTAPPF
jgi:hypothetical protein